MDVDSIDVGLDFVQVLGEKVSACDLMLVVIGPAWSTARDKDGKRRLDDPNDFVRIEVEQALARNVRVIPILVDGAQLPIPDELPLSMQSLVRRQATRLSHERFGSDADGLIAAVKNIVRPSTISLSREGASANDAEQRKAEIAAIEAAIAKHRRASKQYGWIGYSALGVLAAGFFVLGGPDLNDGGIATWLGYPFLFVAGYTLLAHSYHTMKSAQLEYSLYRASKSKSR